MTCIISYIDKKTRCMYMGADSCGSDGFIYSIRKDPKIFIKRNMLIGYTSSFRMGHLLHWTLDIPKHPKNIGLDRYMNTIFIDAVRKCLKVGGYSNINNNVEKGGRFLIGYKGRLFAIDPDFQVGECRNQFDSCGSGANCALGALYAIDNLKSNCDIKKAIRVALGAACARVVSVKPPFKILTLKY